MGGLRRDPIIGQWVIVADKKSSLRPEDYAVKDQGMHQAAIFLITFPHVNRIRILQMQY